jgi:hypothetical protein
MSPARQVPEPPIYTFCVRLKVMPGVWWEIEVAANQTLEDLGEAIPLAFQFTDPHLWSFFLSDKAWDRGSEYALSDPDGGRGVGSAKRTRIREVPLPGVTGKKEFLFLFDYGDEWHFSVKLMGVQDQVEPGASYPRIVVSHGEAPPQYVYENDDREDDWEDEDSEPE